MNRHTPELNQQLNNDTIMDRIRRAARTRIGRVSILAAGAAVAATAYAASSSSRGAEALSHKPAGSELSVDASHLRSSSLSIAQKIVADIAGDHSAYGYKGTYVGVFPGAAKAKDPAMFSGWDPRTNTMQVTSFNKPHGQTSSAYNYIGLSLNVTGKSAAMLDQEAQHGQLTAGDFAAALRDPAAVAAISVQLQTPENAGFETVSIEGSSAMSDTTTYPSVTTKIAGAHGAAVVELFTQKLDTTASTLQQAHETSLAA